MYDLIGSINVTFPLDQPQQSQHQQSQHENNNNDKLFIAIHIGPGKTGTNALQYDTTRHLLNTLFQQEKEYITIKTKSIFPLEKETEIFY
jgi:hypothetical protein